MPSIVGFRYVEGHVPMRSIDVNHLGLERALGRKTMEVEILRAAQEVVKKTPSLRRESGR